MHEDIFWFIDDQDFNAFLRAWTSLYEMQLLVLASYRFWNGFTAWFITIQLENPRFMEYKSNLTGFYQFTLTFLGSILCIIFAIEQAPVTHACDIHS